MIKHPSLAQQERTRPKPYLHRFLDVFITLTLWVIGNFKMALKWNFRSLCLAVPDISKNHHHLYALSPKPLKNLVCPTVLSRNLSYTGLMLFLCDHASFKSLFPSFIQHEFLFPDFLKVRLIPTKQFEVPPRTMGCHTESWATLTSPLEEMILKQMYELAVV